MLDERLRIGLHLLDTIANTMSQAAKIYTAITLSESLNWQLAW